MMEAHGHYASRLARGKQLTLSSRGLPARYGGEDGGLDGLDRLQERGQVAPLAVPTEQLFRGEDQRKRIGDAS